MGYPQNIKVTVDVVVFALQQQRLHILLIQRKNDPFQGQWAIPGGFVEDDEDLLTAARRELQEETSIETDILYQFHTFGQPDRDPRGRTISVAHLALIDADMQQPAAATDAQEVKWFPADALPSLAFDHDKVIKKALTEVQWIHARATNQTQYTRKTITNSDFLLLKDYLHSTFNDPD